MLKDRIREIIAKTVAKFDFHHRKANYLLKEHPKDFDQALTDILTEIQKDHKELVKLSRSIIFKIIDKYEAKKTHMMTLKQAIDLTFFRKIIKDTVEKHYAEILKEMEDE